MVAAATKLQVAWRGVQGRFMAKVGTSNGDNVTPNRHATRHLYRRGPESSISSSSCDGVRIGYVTQPPHATRHLYRRGSESLTSTTGSATALFARPKPRLESRPLCGLWRRGTELSRAAQGYAAWFRFSSNSRPKCESATWGGLCVCRRHALPSRGSSRALPRFRAGQRVRSLGEKCPNCWNQRDLQLESTSRHGTSTSSRPSSTTSAHYFRAASIALATAPRLMRHYIGSIRGFALGSHLS